MDTFISSDNTQGHLIQKYQFKVMNERSHKDGGKHGDSDEEHTPQDQHLEEKTNELVQNQQRVEQRVSGDNKQIQTLLEKTDELSNSLANMQKSYENQQQEFQKMVEQARQEAYEKGKNDALRELQEQKQEQSEQEVQQFAQSISRLDEITKKFEEKIDTIENDLIGTAVDIAKEVINKEVSKNSKDVALNLAYLLLDDIKDAGKITLKVSPKDYGHLKARLQSENIQVAADSSINDGGVMIMSEAGNIDGDLMQRFEKVKDMVFQ